jgi:hypothetical protein
VRLPQLNWAGQNGFSGRGNRQPRGNSEASAAAIGSLTPISNFGSLQEEADSAGRCAELDPANLRFLLFMTHRSNVPVENV